MRVDSRYRLRWRRLHVKWGARRFPYVLQRPPEAEGSCRAKNIFFKSWKFFEQNLIIYECYDN